MGKFEMKINLSGPWIEAFIANKNNFLFSSKAIAQERSPNVNLKYAYVCQFH